MRLCPTGTFSYIIQPYDSLWMIALRYNTTINAIAAENPGADLGFLYIGQVICIPSGSNYSPVYQNSYSDAPVICKSQLNLMNGLRMLWEQHVAWTRMTITSIANNSPDVDLVSSRLLQNPADFVTVLKPIYGNEKALRFGDLLKSHLVIAGQLVNAAKAGDNKSVADAEKKWYANADEIAAFLASINPYWSKETWTEMLHEHLAMTKAEAVDILTKNYQAGIAEYDEIEKQALMMADSMADGIIKQFPYQFNK